MKPAQKQMALKAALFMILATNVSWHTSKAFQSTDLASGGEVGPNGGGVIPARTGGVTTPVLKVEAAPVVTVGPHPDAPISTTTVGVKESTEFKRFCSVDFKIRFIQETEAGKVVTYAYVTQRFPQADLFSLVDEGTYQDQIANVDSKRQWDETIRDTVFEKLKAQGKSCDAQASAPQAPPQSAPADDSDKTDRDVRECMADESGAPLTNSARYQCNLKRLQAISLDTSASDDSDDDDATPGRHHHAAHGAIADVQSALRPLETSIKSLLLNAKSDKQEDGQTRLDDVVETLQAIRDTASSPNDKRAMDKLVDGLQKGYTLGAKVDHEGDRYALALGEVDDQIKDLKASMIGANMYQQMAINQQLQTLMTKRLNIQQIITTNDDYRKLRFYSQDGTISQSDFSEFTTDYNQLLQQINGNTGGLAGLGLATAPSDILSARTQANANDPRAYGSSMAYPQNFNFQQLGLQNPSLIGGTNPAFATGPGAPQLSGYPVTAAPPGFTSAPIGSPAGYPMTTTGVPPGFATTAGAPQLYQSPQMYNPAMSNPAMYNPTVMAHPMYF